MKVHSRRGLQQFLCFMGTTKYERIPMNQFENPTIDAQPCYRKVIGNTTYVVRVHFRETAKETLKNKVKRLIEVETRETARHNRESYIGITRNI